MFRDLLDHCLLKLGLENLLFLGRIFRAKVDPAIVFVEVGVISASIRIEYSFEYAG